MNFHENKLWQSAYVALMDVHDTLDPFKEGEHEEIVEDVLESATAAASKIADALSRTDRRVTRQLLYDAVGLVAVTRTHLAVAWGRELLPDEIFKKLDDQYATLSEDLQRFR